MRMPLMWSRLKHVLELWPYVFVAVSVVGLSYIALASLR